MTENEARQVIECIGEKLNDNSLVFYTKVEQKALDMAIQALEEIQQYRAMEEKLNGISVEQVVNGFINTVEDRTEEPYERGRILTNTEADMWNEYRAIGTVEELKFLVKNIGSIKLLKEYSEIGTIEEFKALKECLYVDERPFIFVCPNCEENYTLEQDERPSFCRKCNEKIDWNKVIFYQL